MAAFLPVNLLTEMCNIGTLLAFVIVCAAVLIMRRTNPQAERHFRCPMVPLVPILGIATCLLLMFSLPTENWWWLGIWLVLGLVIYFCYGRRHSVMARSLEREIREHGVSPGGALVTEGKEPSPLE